MEFRVSSLGFRAWIRRGFPNPSPRTADPIRVMSELSLGRAVFERPLQVYGCSLCDWDLVESVYARAKPETKRGTAYLPQPPAPILNLISGLSLDW